MYDYLHVIATWNSNLEWPVVCEMWNNQWKAELVNEMWLADIYGCALLWCTFEIDFKASLKDQQKACIETFAMDEESNSRLCMEAFQRGVEERHL